MLVGFIGAPCSGKTIIATKMFAELKEQGTNCELVVEAARQYIAKQRYIHKWSPDNTLVLKDGDQGNIARIQRENESIMKYGCGFDTIVISDSSVFNAALYVSKGILDDPNLDFFKNLKNHYDVLFYCHPIILKELPKDPNRIHDLDTILEIQNKASQILKIIKSLNIPVCELLGSLNIQQRYQDACDYTLNYYVEMAKKF